MSDSTSKDSSNGPAWMDHSALTHHTMASPMCQTRSGGTRRVDRPGRGGDCITAAFMYLHGGWLRCRRTVGSLTIGYVADRFSDSVVAGHRTGLPARPPSIPSPPHTRNLACDLPGAHHCRREYAPEKFAVAGVLAGGVVCRLTSSAPTARTRACDAGVRMLNSPFLGTSRLKLSFAGPTPVRNLHSIPRGLVEALTARSCPAAGCTRGTPDTRRSTRPCRLTPLLIQVAGPRRLATTTASACGEGPRGGGGRDIHRVTRPPSTSSSCGVRCSSSTARSWTRQLDPEPARRARTRDGRVRQDAHVARRRRRPPCSGPYDRPISAHTLGQRGQYVPIQGGRGRPRHGVPQAHRAGDRQLLVAEGVSVCVTDLDATRSRALPIGCRRGTAFSSSSAATSSTLTSRKELVTAPWRLFGRLDVLINQRRRDGRGARRRRSARHSGNGPRINATASVLPWCKKRSLTSPRHVGAIVNQSSILGYAPGPALSPLHGVESRSHRT